VVPEALREFFVASTGASATLLGLLFVAIAVEPKSIVGEESPVESRSRASSAYAALINVFFISLFGTIPSSGLRVLPLILAAVGLANTLSIGVNLWRELPHRRSALSSRAGLWLGSTVVYALELWFGWRIVRDPGNPARIYALAYLLIAVYAVALGRAWELLGASEQGLLRTLFSPRSTHEGGEECTEGDGDAPDGNGAPGGSQGPWWRFWR
jgi:hypothetical protein